MCVQGLVLEMSSHYDNEMIKEGFCFIHLLCIVCVNRLTHRHHFPVFLVCLPLSVCNRRDILTRLSR